MQTTPRNNRIAAAALAISLAVIAILGIALARSHNTNKNLTDQNAVLNNRIAALETKTRTTTSTLSQVRINQNNLARQNAEQFTRINTRIDNIENATADVLNEVATELIEIHQTLADHAPRPATASAPDTDYIVQPGDTPETISEATGTSLDNLMTANPNTDWDRLHVGQKLKLPAQTPTPSLDKPPPENTPPPTSE